MIVYFIIFVLFFVLIFVLVFVCRFNLEPPHYDGVQCLSLHGSTLVSGSRDACIKVWQLDQSTTASSPTGADTLNQVLSLNNAHRDWICGLAHLPHGRRVSISGCRGGMLRLWATDSWDAIGEMRAHSSSVNAIAYNSTNIFTASKYLPIADNFFCFCLITFDINCVLIIFLFLTE